MAVEEAYQKKLDLISHIFSLTGGEKAQVERKALYF
jgi:hypothetical protein